MKNLLALIATSNKAIVPVIVAGILALLAGLGITGDMTVQDALTLLVTAVLVWLVPNKKR